MTLSQMNDSPERIAVLRALQLGDTLCCVPAFRALRGAFPHAHIALIGLPWAAALTDRLGAYVDELIEFPGYPGMPERPLRPAALSVFFGDMLARRWDLALQLHGNGLHSNGFVAQLGAKRSAGAHLPGAWRLGPEHAPYPDHLPEVLRPLAVLRELGIEADDPRKEFPLLARDVAELAAHPLASRLPGDYVCLHPGARDPRRRWPAEAFASVGDRLAGAGLTVVLTGTEEERELTAPVRRAMTAEPVDLTGALSLGGLAALLSGARLVITNDTGVSHLADALAVPSVTIFVASDPARWAPLDRDRHAAIGSGHRPNRDATHCCLGDACLREEVRPEAVEVDEVVRAAGRQLERWWSNAA